MQSMARMAYAAQIDVRFGDPAALAPNESVTN
jgi:hypothetical protein